MNIFFSLGQNRLCGITLQSFKLAFMGKYVSTYVTGLENVYDVTSGNDCKCDSVVRCNISPL